MNKKLQSGLVKSIWIQFGTDVKILESRMWILREIISSAQKAGLIKFNIKLFGSILLPSKQLLARFRFRPWKGVYCSNEFLESVDFANNRIKELLKIYNHYEIYPIIGKGAFIDGDIPSSLSQIYNLADENSFNPSL